jgi:hypothetical protein
MEFILAVLLWIGCIQSPGTYTTSEIDSYRYDHRHLIEQVSADSLLVAATWHQYGAATEEVKIIQPWN